MLGPVAPLTYARGWTQVDSSNNGRTWTVRPPAAIGKLVSPSVCCVGPVTDQILRQLTSIRWHSRDLTKVVPINDSISSSSTKLKDPTTCLA